MTAPTSFEIAQGFSNNVGRSQRRQNDISAIDEILIRANQTGNPQDIDSAMSQILQRVSPERQPGALALLQKKQADIMQLKENKALQKNYNVNLNDINDPSIRQQLASTGIQRNQATNVANASRGVNYSNNPSARNSSPPSPAQNATSVPQATQTRTAVGPAPMADAPVQNQPRQNTPIVNSAPSSTGNMPKRTTSGNVQPRLDVDQLLQKGNDIAQQQTDAQNPTSQLEGFALAQQLNNEQQVYNDTLIKEDADRVIEQDRYNKMGVAALSQYFPEGTPDQASPEMKNIFEKKAEQAALRGDSEADIKKSLVQDAKNLKDRINNIKKSIKPPSRVWNKIGNAINNSKNLSDESVKNSTRIKVQPLLDDGLYDEARQLLDQVGYYPEEREAILTDQGENTKKILAQLSAVEQPKFKPTADKPFPQEVPLTQRQLQDFQSNLSQLVQADPSTNLVLLRKSYEDKGIDWTQFKDGIDQLIINGQLKLSPDQENQFRTLETPPLDRLEWLLHKLNLRGR